MNSSAFWPLPSVTGRQCVCVSRVRLWQRGGQWCGVGGDLLQGGVALATAAIEKTDQRCHVYWNCRSLHYCMMFLLAGGSRSVSECCSSQAGQDVNPAQSLKHPPNWLSFQSWIFHWWHRLCLCGFWVWHYGNTLAFLSILESNVI